MLGLFCRKWGLSVNISKTKVVVCRKGGKLGSKEIFYYCGQMIKTVTYYKYLRILLSSRNVWTKGVVTLSLQGWEAMRPVNLLITRLQGLALEASFTIFDKRILPTLCYGIEIWGYERKESFEKVNVAFCRFVLGVGKCSIPSAVFGECGRPPVICTYLKRPVRCWLKALKLGEGSVSI